MNQQHNRRERILIAVDDIIDDDYYDEENIDGNGQDAAASSDSKIDTDDSTPLLIPSTTDQTIHVRLESSTTEEFVGGETSSSPSLRKSLFISQHAIELLSSSVTTKFNNHVGVALNENVVSSTNTTTSTATTTTSTSSSNKRRNSRSRSTHRNDAAIVVRVVNVHIQAANQPSQSYPTTTTMPTRTSCLLEKDNVCFDDDYDNNNDDVTITGPSGIMVQVNFEVTIPTPISETTTIQQQQHNQLLLHMVQQHFISTVLPYLSGHRRIIVAPLATIQNIKLHRHVRCHPTTSLLQQDQQRYSSPRATSSTTTISGIQCTTILPLDGTHAAFSIEGFRTFLQQQQQQQPPEQGSKRKNSSYSSGRRNTGARMSSGDGGGIWSNMASPKAWSHFFIGSGYTIPQSLSEATQSFTAETTGSGTTNHQLPGGSGTAGAGAGAAITKRRQLVNRHMYWINWGRKMNKYDNGTNATTFETTYGIQYSMKFQTTSVYRQLLSQNISLNDLLPNNNNDDDHCYQSDPFADRSTIEIITSSGSCNTIRWGSASQSILPSSTTRRTGGNLVRLVSPFESISRVEPLFVINQKERQRNFPSNKTSPALDSLLSSPSLQYWKVQTHIYRPYPGQAYRGTYVGMIQNQLTGCDGISIHAQQFIPAVIEPVWQSLHVQISSRTTTTATTTPQKSPESIIVPWNELDYYHVDFQNDGSYVLLLKHVIPSQSIFEIVLEYEPKYMNVDYFPADANRGFEIPPMIVQVNRLELDGSDSCHEVLQHTYRDHPRAPIVTLYSNALFILAPLPDMSMPFNVLSFTCTFYVFVIGSLINLVLKKVSAQMKAKLQSDSTIKKESKMQLLKRQIRTKVQRLFSKGKVKVD